MTIHRGVECYDPYMQSTPALTPLLMNARPLADVLTVKPERWGELAAKLAVTYPQVTGEDVVYTLGTVYYAFKQNRLVVPYSHDGNEKLVEEVVDFLEAFMTANGQWPYLNDQPWYKNHGHVIGIDINFYPNRAQKSYKVTPQFHKDTGGNNIFVNLVFDNANPIEATEWFVDVEEPGGLRAKWQERLLPAEHRKELADLRAYLRDHRGEQQSLLEVQGGVLEGRHICVSWVDDLVWHATPTVNKRYEYHAATANADYDATNAAATYLATVVQPYRSVDNYNTDDYRVLMYQSSGNFYIHLVELIGTIADDPDTRLAAWLNSVKKRQQDIDCDVAVQAWMAIYAKDRATFEKDVTLRDRASWRLTGGAAEATAYDVRLAKDTAIGESPSITEPPVGLAKLRRANSAGSEEFKKRLADVAAANAKVPRRFIRTWVRILPKTSEELKAAGFKVQ